jgi:hypothetical protein
LRLTWQLSALNLSAYSLAHILHHVSSAKGQYEQCLGASNASHAADINTRKPEANHAL